MKRTLLIIEFVAIKKIITYKLKYPTIITQQIYFSRDKFRNGGEILRSTKILNRKFVSKDIHLRLS
jgi:hypothetical protein